MWAFASPSKLPADLDGVRDASDEVHVDEDDEEGEDDDWGEADMTLVCRECSSDFVFTKGEQIFYREKGVRVCLPLPAMVVPPCLPAIMQSGGAWTAVERAALGLVCASQSLPVPPPWSSCQEARWTAQPLGFFGEIAQSCLPKRAEALARATELHAESPAPLEPERIWRRHVCVCACVRAGASRRCAHGWCAHA